VQDRCIAKRVVRGASLVAGKCIAAHSIIKIARGVSDQCPGPDCIIRRPPVLAESALKPKAVLSLILVLLRSALAHRPCCWRRGTVFKRFITTGPLGGAGGVAFFCYKRQLASVGDALRETHSDHAEKPTIEPKRTGKL
jgi:hypothetical protein